jgi:hypothetical protein
MDTDVTDGRKENKKDKTPRKEGRKERPGTSGSSHS